mgnify:CR=1 FL=1
MPQHRIVIVGGGAGGLELACKLGRRMGAEQVTLVDQQLFHFEKGIDGKKLQPFLNKNSIMICQYFM